MSEILDAANDTVLISVIIPVYKVEKYIRRCIDSVLNQSYKNIEIILVDDGSPDNCGKICDEYKEIDKRVCVFHKENGGLSDARNYGVMHARGEYIVFIDSDDYVENDYIDYLFSLINKYGTKMSLCQHRTIFNNGHIKEINLTGDSIMSCKDCLENMLYHNIIDTSAWAKMYHKSLLKDVFFPKGKIFEDIGTTYLFFLQCDYIAVGYERKYNYIFHDDSIVNSVFNEAKFNMLEMTDKMAKDVESAIPELSKAVLRRRVYSRFSTLNQMLYSSQYDDEKHEIINFIKTNKYNVLVDKKAPKRDKIAIVLLCTSYNLYKRIWIIYRKRIMGD